MPTNGQITLDLKIEPEGRKLFMRDLLMRMFKAWELHEASWIDHADGGHGAYEKTDDECYIEACDGDVVMGCMLGLFAHWSNDIQTMAPHFGIGWDNGKFSTDIPPAPSPLHWWHVDHWKAPIEEKAKET